MPFSQMYPQYPEPSYDNQQPNWDEVDFTTVRPAPNNNDSFTKALKDNSDFYDLNTLPVDNQNVPSPNYSQFLNFESSDVGSYSVPSEDVSTDSYYRTSPASFNAPLPSSSTTTANNDNNNSYPWKIEPDLDPNDALASCGQAGECSPQRCGPDAACLQLSLLPEIEECNTAPCLTTTDAAALLEPSYIKKSSRSNSGSLDPAVTVKEERDRKPRSKRNHKGSSSDEDTAHARAKQAHSVVERRYRDNLNGKIMQLHRALVATESTSRLTGMPTQDFFASREHRGKVRKSDVMTDAMNYVHQSEVEIRHMSDEILRLNDRVHALEKLVKCEDCTLLKQMVRLQLQHPQ